MGLRLRLCNIAIGLQWTVVVYSILTNGCIWLGYIQSQMLKFNPQNYIPFTPNSQQKLEGSFSISNPTNNCSCAFKIKSTKPQLFIVKPYVGVLPPLAQIQVVVCTVATNSAELARQIAHEHKFLIEYAMLDRSPQSVSEGIQSINEDNRQAHKLYINTNTVRGSLLRDDAQQAHSVISHLSYRSAKQHHEQPQKDNKYEEMGNEEKFQHLKDEIDKMEKQRSELIMGSKPQRTGANLIKYLVVAVLMLVLGNILGRTIGLHELGRPAKQKKQRQYRYFGLQRYWAEEEQTKREVKWWQFWG